VPYCRLGATQLRAELWELVQPRSGPSLCQLHYTILRQQGIIFSILRIHPSTVKNFKPIQVRGANTVVIGISEVAIAVSVEAVVAIAIAVTQLIFWHEKRRPLISP